MRTLSALATMITQLMIAKRRKAETEVKPIAYFFTLDELLALCLDCEEGIVRGNRVTQNDVDIYNNIVRGYLDHGLQAPMTPEKAAWLRRFAARK